MSHIWSEVHAGNWQSKVIAEDTPLDGDQLGVPGIRFFRFGQGADRGVGLLVRPDVHVAINGQPLSGGFRHLEHRDEVLAGHTRFYFSSESTPVVVPFAAPPGSRTCTCPVCRGAIRDGQAAVQCPNCTRWFHQMEATDGQPARRCWTYAPGCRNCGHPTALDGGTVWRPEKEESNV